MKKKKKQTVYNLSPTMKAVEDPGTLQPNLGGGNHVPTEDINPVTLEEPQKDDSKVPVVDGPEVGSADCWTIAGITWERKKWFVILALLAMNVITLVAVAFKKN